MNDDRLDFDVIRANAAKDGIDLAEITIIYEELTSIELAQMRSAGLVASSTGSKVFGKFAQDGSVMFPKKATGVFSLGAT